MTGTNDPIAEAIIAHWGERCDDTMEGCPICDAWAAYDRLRIPMTRDTDLIRRGDAPERIWLTTTETGKVDDFTRWTDQPPRECDLWDTGYIRADLATPAPVVPAEGLAEAMERLQTEICCADGDRVDDAKHHSDGSERVDLWSHTAEFDVDDVRMVLTALRSAPPVGARVSIPSGLIDALRSQRQIDADGCEVAVSRQACDEAAAILAALLPAGEGE